MARRHHQGVDVATRAIDALSVGAECEDFPTRLVDSLKVEISALATVFDPVFDDLLQLAEDVLLFVLLNLRLVLVVVFLEDLLDASGLDPVDLLCDDLQLLSFILLRHRGVIVDRPRVVSGATHAATRLLLHHA